MNTKLNQILAEISAGELLDKITILEIKKEKIKDIQKLEDSVAKIMDKRADVLIEYRRTRKQRYLDEANAILKDALKTIKTFSKVELLASLSKR